jgi:hypothetical protein
MGYSDAGLPNLQMKGFYCTANPFFGIWDAISVLASSALPYLAGNLRLFQI